MFHVSNVNTLVSFILSSIFFCYCLLRIFKLIICFSTDLDQIYAISIVFYRDSNTGAFFIRQFVKMALNLLRLPGFLPSAFSNFHLTAILQIAGSVQDA